MASAGTGLPGKTLPWADWHEWLRCYQGLSGQSVKEKLEAVSLVDLWRIRGRVPVAVDITGMVLQIMCHDPYFTPETTAQVSLDELQQLYSLAVIRLCNGVIDTEQKGLVAQSQDSIARRIGFPTWLVELRHEATHGSTLPTIHVLRMAAESILRYLDKNYWSRQYAQLDAHGVFAMTQPDADYGDVRLPRGASEDQCVLLRKKLAALGHGVGVTEAVKYFTSSLSKVASTDDIREMILNVTQNVTPATERGASAVDVLAGALEFLEVKRPGLGRGLARSLLERVDDTAEGKRSMQWFEALSRRSAMSGAKEVCFEMTSKNPSLIDCLGDSRLTAAFNSNERPPDAKILAEIEKVALGLGCP
ncbi:LAS1-like [Perkinsus olseni]|uniref:LAS1-like n=2 Tax=Perkinsus olseni TaxID=32597 RepID=A0A7J6SUZ4_PEROL|nr:LAS1-like [Perkinsus olseni]